MADSNYTASTKFTVDTDQAVSSVKTVADGVKDLAAKWRDASANSKSFETDLKSVADAAEKAATKIKQTGDAITESVSTMAQGVRGAEQALNGLAGGSLSTAMTGLSSLAGSFGKVGEGSMGAATAIIAFGVAAAGAYASYKLLGEAFDIAKQSLEAIKAQEQLTITIAATMSATNSWATSTAIAATQLEKLKETAALVGMTTPQVVDAFNMLKRTFGGTSDEAVVLTNNLAILARSYNTDVATLAQRLAQAANTGVLMPRGPAGTALISTGIDPVELQRMKDAGLAMEYLNGRIQGNTELVEALKNSWQYLTGEFEKNKNTALELIGQGLEPLKETLKDILAYTSSDAFKNMMKEWGARFSEIIQNAIGEAQLLLLLFRSMLATAATVSAGAISVAGNVLVGSAPDPAAIKAVYDNQIAADKAFTDAKAAEDAKRITRAQATSDAIVKIQVDEFAKIKKITDALGPVPFDQSNLMQGNLMTQLSSGEFKTKPAPDRVAKIKDENDAIILATQNLWAKTDAYDQTGLDHQLDMITAETQKEINVWEDAYSHHKVSYNNLLGYLNAAYADSDKRQQALIDASNEKIATAWQKLQDEIAASTTTGQDKQIAAVQTWIDTQVAALKKLSLSEEQYWDFRLAIGTVGINRLNTIREADNEAYKNADAKLHDELAATSDDTLTKAIANHQKQLDSYIKTVDQSTKYSAEQKTQLIADATAVRDAQIAASQMAALGVQSNLKSISDFTKGIWTDMGNAFQTGFYDVVAGKWDDFRLFLKNLWDSILKDFSNMLAQMLKKWVYNLVGMGDASQGQGASGAGGSPNILGGLVGLGGQQGNQGFSNGANGLSYNGQQVGLTPANENRGGAGGMGTIGAGGLLAGGYMAGNAIYTGLQSNKQPYTIAGQQYTGDFGGNSKFGDYVAPALTIAAVSLLAGGTAITLAGTTLIAAGWTGYGLIAAAVILLVGAIISIINGPKEAKFAMDTAQMKDPNSPIGQAMMQTYGQTYGSLSNIYNAGGGAKGGFSQYMNANLAGTESWQPTLHAGSGADLTKDAQYFFSNVLPKLNIEQAFGQNWSGQYHGNGPNNGLAGAGISGVPIMDPGSFDPSAPIPMMLTKLGMTAKEIKGIALQIDLRDPDKFLEWLGRVVNVTVGFKNTIANLNESLKGIQADADKAAWHGGYNPLQEASQNVVDLASEIKNYVGDEQLTKMEELQKASDAYYQSCVAALKVLTDMMNAVNNQVKSFSDSVAQIGKDAGWLASDRTNRMGITSGIGPGGQYGPELANDQTTAQVQTTWDAFMKDANDQLNYLISILNNLNAAMDTLKNLATGFQGIVDGTYGKTFTDTASLTGESGRLAGINITTGNGADGKPVTQSFLDNVGLLSTGLGNLLTNLTTFMNAIDAGSKALTEGVAADIWKNNYTVSGHRDKSGTNANQKGILQSKINEDLSKIDSATDPTTVNQNAGEIRSLLGTYEGLFSPDDPGYEGAFSWADSILGDLDKRGQAAFTTMHNAGVAIGKEWSTGQSMETSQQLLQDAIDATTTSITNLNTAVIAFGALVNTKLSGWATDIQTDMKKAAAALTEAMNNFTTALGGPDSTATGTTPGKGPIKPITDLGTAATGAVGDDSSGLLGVAAACNKIIAAVG